MIFRLVVNCPLYLSCAFIIEEGLEINEFEQTYYQAPKAAKDADTQIITEIDIKVVEKVQQMKSLSILLE